MKTPVFLKQIWTRLLAIVDTLLVAVQQSATSITKLVGMVLLVIAAIDVVTMGRIGMVKPAIEFVVATIKDGGWPMIAVAAILMMWLDNKK